MTTAGVWQTAVSLLLLGVSLNFDEFFVSGDFLHQTVQVLFAASKHGVSHATGVQSDSLGRVIVTRNHVIQTFWRVVGINHGHNGDTQSAGFGHSNLVVADVDHEQGVRQVVHV